MTIDTQEFIKDMKKAIKQNQKLNQILQEIMESEEISEEDALNIMIYVWAKKSEER